MLDIVEGSPHTFADVSDFIKGLNGLETFSPQSDVWISRAPGRLDVMGGIADYSGSLVLQLPLEEATLAAVQLRPRSRDLHIVSLGIPGHPNREFSMPLTDFGPDGAPIFYEEARSYFESRPESRWAAYAAGAFLVLMREAGAQFSEGATILIRSSVPEGRGVSSSAALEVAVMKALTAACEIRLSAIETALLCQKVENMVVGAPCGIMDQMTSVLGRKDQLLTLRCQPAEVLGSLPIPPHICFWGIDSGTAHQISAADYRLVRTAAFMGYRIMAEKAGFALESVESNGPVRINDPLWNGYLANLSPSLFEERYAGLLPEQAEGGAFLSAYGETTDSVCRVRPGEYYRVGVAAAHPIYEHLRVRLFVRLLQGAAEEEDLRLLGELMYQSHASYSKCGLGSEGTDQLVALAREMGPEKGIYGAKITGGGSGGTVAFLGRADAGEALAELAARHGQATGQKPYTFRGSSDGADAFGTIRLRVLATN